MEMKKIIFVLTCLVSFATQANNTDYTSVDECMHQVEDYSIKAYTEKQSKLANWFHSFATNDYLEISDIATIVSGCALLNKQANFELWLKMQAKLNQQIIQLQTNQSSLFGNRAQLVCNVRDFHINIPSCR